MIRCIEVDDFDHAQVVERTNQRHDDGKYGQPNMALFQESHNHAEFGVEAHQRRNTRHGEHRQQHQEGKPCMALVKACEVFDVFTFNVFGGQYHQNTEADCRHQSIGNGVIQTCSKADCACHKRQQDKAHVRYGRIGKHTFDIGLHDGGKVTDHQRSNGKNGQHRRPV